MQLVRDWTLRLSRGEYEDHLYWECVAEDCEEAGDWAKALSAYSAILNLPKLDSLDYARACSAIGAIHSLLGDDLAVSASYRLASAKSEDDVRVLWRHFIANEVWHLSRMGHVRRAGRSSDVVSFRTKAKLSITSAPLDC